MMANAINSLNYGNNIYTFTLPYGVCETAADTAAKEVTVDNFSLETGAVVIVKFTNSNGASSPTLNVNGTGAKPIYRYGTTTASTTTTTSGWTAGAVQMFTYDGTGWIRDYWSNTTYSNASLGQGYATCSTAAATVAKVGTLSSYSLTTGGIVSVKFTYDVPASATLNINSKGAKSIYYRGAAITAGIIKAGDIATFIYSSQYHLISIDRWQNDITNIQTSLDGKQAIITGGATTITGSNLTASRALVSDSNGKVAVSAVTSTELGYLDGVTSAIQTQLGGKAPNSHASTATTYGIGTSSNYGHVKLSDATNSTSAASAGIAASPAAVKAAYDLANQAKTAAATAQSTADSKQAAITGGATTITSSNLTVNRALISNSSGKVAVSDVTSTELSYLDGVTSNIQNQLDSKKSLRTVRFTVGTSSSGWTSSDCDYLCDGTSDQTEINAAITALPSTGGEVVLLDGTYDISGEIKLNKANVTLRGNGASTKIGVTTSYNTNYLVINITGSNCTVKDLYINPTAITSTATCIMLGSSVSNCIIENNACVGGTTGIVLNSGQYNRVLNNFIQASKRTSTYGIDLRSGSNNDTIISNVCIGNGCGIAISGSTSVAIANHIIADNTCNDGDDGLSLNFAENCTVTGNACNNNYSAGIYFRGNNNTISGNTCYSNVMGIQTGSTSNNNIITGNIARESTSTNMRLAGTNYSIISNNNISVLSTDESASADSLELYSTGNNYNIITDNHLGIKNYSSGGGTGNSFVNNYYDGAPTGITLTEGIDYGTELPTEAPEGKIFFLKV